MTKVVVSSGICGMEVIIEVSTVDKRKVKLEIVSACKMVNMLGEALRELDPMDTLKGGGGSLVWQQASMKNLHSDCPVPIGILKAIQVETEMALPCDAVIHFEVPPGRTGIPVIRKEEKNESS